MRQRKQLQLWVHYRQALGAWGWRINTGGVVVWSSSMADYRTEYEAIDAARDAWERYTSEPAPQSTIYRTDMEYARASWQQSRR